MSHAGNGQGNESNTLAFQNLPCRPCSVIAQTDVLAFELPANIAIELFTADASVWSYFHQVGQVEILKGQLFCRKDGGKLTFENCCQVIPSVWKGVYLENEVQRSRLSSVTRVKGFDTHHDDPLNFVPRPGEIYHL